MLFRYISMRAYESGGLCVQEQRDEGWAEWTERGEGGGRPTIDAVNRSSGSNNSVPNTSAIRFPPCRAREWPYAWMADSPPIRCRKSRAIEHELVGPM